MKRLALVALAATFLGGAGGAALAEPWQGHGDGGHDGGNHQTWNGGGHNNPAPNGGAEHRNFQGGNPGFQGGGNPGFQGNHNFRGNPNFQGGGGNNVYRGNPNWQGGGNGGNPQYRYQGGNNNYRGNPSWQGGNNTWRDDHHRDFNGGGYDHRNYDRGSNYNMWRGDDDRRGDWHGGGNYAWRGPHAGWGYHRWGYGAYIPRSFLIDSFFLYDYADYDLGVPPPGCEWVQDGPNALLIDVYTGEVLQVVPDAFDY